MQAALIAMTILGCDDGISECRYVETTAEHWVSIELCDAASERILTGYSNLPYPMVIAVCQAPDKPVETAAAPATATPEAKQTDTTVSPAEQTGIAGRAMAAVRDVMPGTKGIRMAFEAPVHVVSDSYAWVAKKLGVD